MTELGSQLLGESSQLRSWGSQRRGKRSQLRGEGSRLQSWARNAELGTHKDEVAPDTEDLMGVI